jgi:hypothetical protein
MVDGVRSIERSWLKRVVCRFRSPIVAVLLLFAVPAVGYYCWQSQSDLSSVAIGQNEEPLSPKTSISAEGSWIQQFLNPIGSSRFATPNSDHKDPLLSASSRVLIAAQSDPFMLALAAGSSEGMLVVKEVNGKVRTLGLVVSKPAAIGPADLEILRAIQSGVGGSFHNFFANVYGGQQRESAQLAEGGSTLEENPFSKAVASIAETAASEKTGTLSASQDTSNTKDSKTSNTEKKGEPAVSSSLLNGVTSARPHLLMNMGDEGTFHLTAVSQPREGILESSDLGVRDFSILPFSDVAEFPIAIAVADFNGDGQADVAFHVSQEGLVRFFYGSSDGSYEEGLRIEAGHGPRSIAAADFNLDGIMDLAVSGIGTGGVTVLFGDAQGNYRYRSFWSEMYRDYITAAATQESANPSLIGMNFANQASILYDFTHSIPNVAGWSFNYTPSLNTEVFNANGLARRVNAVVLASNLSLNIDNRMNQMINILNLVSGTNVYVVVGDLGGNGRMCVGLAKPRP